MEIFEQTPENLIRLEVTNFYSRRKPAFWKRLLNRADDHLHIVELQDVTSPARKVLLYIPDYEAQILYLVMGAEKKDPPDRLFMHHLIGYAYTYFGFELSHVLIRDLVSDKGLTDVCYKRGDELIVLNPKMRDALILATNSLRPIYITVEAYEQHLNAGTKKAS
jgi:bifunctional DNase/RNase